MMKKFLIIISFILININSVSVADLGSKTYIEAKNEYQNENYKLTYELLSSYLEDNILFLNNNPSIKSKILIVIDYCAFRLVFSGIDSSPPPQLP